MIGVGFASGIVLNLVLHERSIDEVPWTDPIIWRTALMFAWLLVAAVFSAIYRPARSGRKVAYLTVASFAFLAVSLGLGLLLPSEHGGAATEKQKAESRRQNEEAQTIDGATEVPAVFCLLPSAFCLRGVPLMKLQMVGCSHHNASVEVRERLAFSPDQAATALGKWRESFPTTEAVLLSTCNRVELYTAADDPDAGAIRSASEAVSGRFSRPAVAAGVRRFVRAIGRRSRAAFVHRRRQPRQHGAGRAANSRPSEAGLSTGMRASEHRPDHARHFPAGFARRQARGDGNFDQRKAVSIASVAVTDFARNVFERFDDKQVLVIGAGETAEETLVYLKRKGRGKSPSSIAVANAAEALAEKLWRQGRSLGRAG